MVLGYTMSELAIEVRDLTKHYGPVRAVENINFTVQAGELVGFLGPNGAGKSTTMRILTTYLPATSGIVKICGFDVFQDSMQVRQRIGYLPESVPLYPDMRVEEYLLYRAKLKGVPRQTRLKMLEEYLEKCRIKEVRKRLLGTLSKGYRQRVGLADALIASPNLLILDEPTSGLDPVQIRETLNTIKSLGGKHTVLLSTHILSEVESICDRVVIISRGTLRWDGRLSELAKEHPTYRLEVKGNGKELCESLQKISGIQQAQVIGQQDGHAFIEIEPQTNVDIRERISQTVFEKGMSLFAFETKRKNLESLYMDVVLRPDSRTISN